MTTRVSTVNATVCLAGGFAPPAIASDADPALVVFDAVRYGVELGPEVWTTLQEWAYWSPIWYTP